MKINLGPAIAHCEICGGTHFDFASEAEALKEAPALVCRSCARQVRYAELLLQIEAQALAAARNRLRTSHLL